MSVIRDDDDEEKERHALSSNVVVVCTQWLHFFYMKIYIFFRSIRGWLLNRYSAPQLLWFAIRWRAWDFILFPFLFRGLQSHYLLHMYVHVLFVFHYSTLTNTHTHTRIRTRFKSVSAFLSCHTIRALLLYFTLTLALLLIFFHFLPSGRILFLFSLQFVCHFII